MLDESDTKMHKEGLALQRNMTFVGGSQEENSFQPISNLSN